MGKTMDFDGTLYRGLKGAINQGVDLYKAGDHYGCYRLFQGIVVSLKPVFADRPDLQRTIDAGLADAERQAEAWQRAWTLRRALDEIRVKLKENSAHAAAQMPERAPAVKAPKVKTRAENAEDLQPDLGIKPAAKKTDTKSKLKSLWHRLGGQTKVAKIIDDFTDLAAADPKVNFTRGGKIKLNDAAVTHFKQEMIDFVSSATNGPLPYTGKSMKAAHKGMGITNAEFNAVAADLKKVLLDNGVEKADIDAVLALAETTRKDIVEEPDTSKAPVDKNGVEKKPAEKNGAEKRPAGQKPAEDPPFEQIQVQPTKTSRQDRSISYDICRAGSGMTIRCCSRML